MRRARDQRRRRLCPPRAAAAAALAATLVAVAGPTPLAAEQFEFQKLNRTYGGFVDELTPVVLGPVEVLLRSPRHALDLARHRASLEPAEDGTHFVSVEIELSGHGTIDAVLRAAGLEGKLQDELTLPLQTLVLEGRIALASGVEGYAIRLVEAPEQVEVRIESQLAGRLVPLCRQMALVLVRFDCLALDDALSRVQVPIPRPGSEFLLPHEELTAAERGRLDRYLAASAQR